MTRAEWWLSSEKMTVWVQTDGFYIRDAAPIVRRFIGQGFLKLVRWMRSQGGLQVRRLGRD